MSRITSVTQAATIIVVLISSTVAQTPTTALDSCRDDLDGLRKAAAEASDAAEDANSKRDDFDDCRRDPEVHDLMGDNCKSLDSDYQSALSDLESEMDDVDSRLHSVQDSCDYVFTANKLTSSEAAQQRLENAQRRLCASYRRLVDSGASHDTVLQMCKAHTGDQWCRQCLGLK